MRLLPVVFLASSAVACTGDSLGTGSAEQCTTATAYTIGSSVNGSIASGDCKDAAGHIGDLYSFTATGQTSFMVTVSGSGSPEVILYQGTVASLSSAKKVIDGETSANAFLPAGSYLLIVGGNAGNYTLTTGAANTNGCNTPSFAMRGVTVTGTITANDCAAALASSRQDIYEIWMDSGSTLSVNASVSQKGGVLFRTGDASSADLITKPIAATTGGSASFTYTASKSDNFRVHLLSDVATTATSNYSFTIN